MVRIPGGSFMMGSEDGAPKEGPQHRVEVAPFELDITEVTVGAYTECVRAGRCAIPDSGGGDPRDRGKCTYDQGAKNQPMNCVDWSQAAAFCQAQGKRLPTEQEWEFAARGGPEERSSPWGSDAPGTQLCWQGLAKRGGTCEVGSFPPGAYGLMDMVGNVWEWTADDYAADYSRVPDHALRAIRGGGWSSPHPGGVRGTSRDGAPPSFRLSILGFRCAR